MTEEHTPQQNEQRTASSNKGSGIKLVAPARASERAGEIKFVDMPRERSDRLDVLVLNPPSPDGDLFLRDIARVGRRTRDGIIWPQTALAQIGAVVQEAGYTVDVIDAIGLGMTWEQFESYMLKHKPRYMIIHATAPTLTNDMRTTFVGKSVGTISMAIGTHVTPMSRETLESYPSLDVVIRGEPELSILDVIKTIDRKVEADQALDTVSVGNPDLTAPWRKLPFPDASYLTTRGRFLGINPALVSTALRETKGIAFRDMHGQVQINPDRPFIENLDDLPIPLHDKLPWQKYKVPIIGGPYTFVLTSRGCPAGCRYCIKHVTYQSSVRHRSPDHVLKEMYMLKKMGMNHIHFEADLFTVKQDFVYDLCNTIIKDGLQLRWSCNSRVDFVDEEQLRLMKKAGCFMIAWGLESGSEQVLKRARKGTTTKRIHETISASNRAGIMNWGYFIIGLPGETVETIRQTIDISKKLPLDIALFHIATPYPGTPFYYEAVQNGWIQMDRWEDYDMYNHTVLNYPDLSSADLEYWARRAAREWSLRPGPIKTFLKGAANLDTLGQLWQIGTNHIRWMGGSLTKVQT
ncbi:MAG: B12-binding domain-containing radical SAM protein [Chloroflexi bacterium AL-W]|nr:B12-binding domain-containing radical SAM protein [Chloroflexi bacterium AL-N1]NOK68579.1 B12-binding domain-containing radical SAM protein [Chloroflexi bacterium AL-N10]NOK76065.1 B12-binding domain-containing radical SAM protein [Chloroflexi bacterium AL-N5]NOK82538.1 B12-binding domain-containing radical SAM protein [Chloroflexi bacterium AL-W]NOK92848.1 B12-binding domain-containing radical SAM protein [Chloroflexi bacterium AL-N15]